MRPRTRHDPRRDLVGFVVGDVSYAVAIGAVREVTLPLRIDALPQAPPAVLGVADYRGVIVPVIDLRQRFGLPAAPLLRRKWLLCDVGGRQVALVVDRVSEVFGTAGAALRPPPLLGTGADVRGLAGVTELDGRLVFVLDVMRFAELTAQVGREKVT
ncbi:MAG: purine-binding chemotaxis protein CheW [Myxococcales bacterium]|nr:purine-binding chemotaxis protein CheW [Myxococcales bacterium]